MRSEDEKRYDVRIIERNLRDGIVEPQDYKKALAALPDVSDQAVRVAYEDIARQRVGRLAARERDEGLADVLDD